MNDVNLNQPGAITNGELPFEVVLAGADKVDEADASESVDQVVEQTTAEFLEEQGQIARIGEWIEAVAPEDQAAFDTPQSPKFHGEGPTLRYHLAQILYQYEALQAGTLNSDAPEWEAVVKALSEEEVRRFIVLHDIRKDETKGYKIENPEDESDYVDADHTKKVLGKMKSKTPEAKAEKDKRTQERNTQIESKLVIPEGADVGKALFQQGISIQNIGHDQVTDEMAERFAITDQEKMRIELHMLKDPDQFKSLVKKYCAATRTERQNLGDADYAELKNIYGLSVLDSMGRSGKNVVQKESANFDAFIDFLNAIKKENEKPALPQSPIPKQIIGRLGGKLKGKFGRNKQEIEKLWPDLSSAGGDADKIRAAAASLEDAEVIQVLVEVLS